MQHNKGRLILCTFPITENYSDDPFAFNMFQNLVDYISSKDFKSNFNLLIN